MSVYKNYALLFRLLILLTSLSASTPLYAILSGSLETRFQSDSYFDNGNYVEQWLTLDSHSKDDDLTLGMLGSYDTSGHETLINLHRLYIKNNLFADNLSIKAGRFERIDEAGFYTLDGAELFWKDASNTGWNWFVGKQTRSEIYLFSRTGDDSVDQPDSKYLSGLSMSQPLNTNKIYWLDAASFSLGTRYHWSGANAWKLDGRFAADWLPIAAYPPIELDSAMVLNTDNFALESFDIQAIMRLSSEAQLWFKGRRFDLHDEPMTFEGRYYHYYGKGWQTVLETGYQEQYSKNVTWKGGLKTITREQGLNGLGLDLSVDWVLSDASLLQGGMEWLKSADESASGLFLGYQRPVNSRMLLQINTAVRSEQNRMSGNRNIVAAEMHLEWMWTRVLHLTSMLELARSDGPWDKYNQVRFGLRLVYQLPVTGSESYR